MSDIINSKNSVGILYLVATPIGNLKDITLRALEVLNEVDIVACEDTRHTLQLLTHFDIRKPLVSYHEHNKYDKLDELVNELLNGKKVALVTDAGTPIISDPGDVLVKEAIVNNIEVTSIPGACALINALVLSGFSAKNFIFIGFLPDNKKEKIEKLSIYVDREEILIIYSSKSQIKKDIDLIAEIFGNDKNITISRELTKIHEQVMRGTVKEIKDNIKDIDLLGEFVVCIEGLSKEEIDNNEKQKWANMTIKEHVNYYVNGGLSENEAIKKVSKDRDINKNEVYKIIKVKEKNDG